MKNFTNFTDYTRIEDLKRLEFILNAVSGINRKPLNIIEVGCGNGHISYQLARSGFTVKGVDISPDAIAKARARYSDSNLTYEVISAEQLNTGVAYDIVIMSEVLEHLTDPAQVLGVVAGMLKKDGIAVITVPNGCGPREVFVTRPVQKIFKNNGFLSGSLQKLKQFLGYQGVTIQSANNDLTHIQFFSLSALQALANQSGLKIIKTGAANLLDGVFPFSFVTRRSLTMQRFDCWVADRVPIRWVSGFNTIMVKK